MATGLELAADPAKKRGETEFHMEGGRVVPIVPTEMF